MKVSYREAAFFIVGYLIGGLALFALVMFFSAQAVAGTWPPKGSRVVELNSVPTVTTELAKPGPMVLYYGADWCGPCHAFRPTYEKLSKEMPEVRFLYMNSDKLALKEHVQNKVAPFIPFILVGKDEKQLRNSPCQQPFNLVRTPEGVKAFIKGCLK